MINAITNRTCVAIVMALVMAGACTNGGHTGVADTEKNKAAATGLFNAFNRHDWKTMAGYYREPASFLDPSFGKGYVTRSRQQTVDKYAELAKQLPGIKDSIVSIFGWGNKVTVEFVSVDSGFTLPICTVLTFNDGLVTNDATYYDNSK